MHTSTFSSPTQQTHSPQEAKSSATDATPPFHQLIEVMGLSPLHREKLPLSVHFNFTVWRTSNVSLPKLASLCARVLTLYQQDCCPTKAQVEQRYDHLLEAALFPYHCYLHKQFQMAAATPKFHKIEEAQKSLASIKSLFIQTLSLLVLLSQSPKLGLSDKVLTCWQHLIGILRLWSQNDAVTDMHTLFTGICHHIDLTFISLQANEFPYSQLTSRFIAQYACSLFTTLPYIGLEISTAKASDNIAPELSTELQASFPYINISKMGRCSIDQVSHRPFPSAQDFPGEEARIEFILSTRIQSSLHYARYANRFFSLHWLSVYVFETLSDANRTPDEWEIILEQQWQTYKSRNPAKELGKTGAFYAFLTEWAFQMSLATEDVREVFKSLIQTSSPDSPWLKDALFRSHENIGFEAEEQRFLEEVKQYIQDKAQPIVNEFGLAFYFNHCLYPAGRKQSNASVEPHPNNTPQLWEQVRTWLLVRALPALEVDLFNQAEHKSGADDLFVPQFTAFTRYVNQAFYKRVLPLQLTPDHVFQMSQPSLNPKTIRMWHQRGLMWQDFAQRCSTYFKKNSPSPSQRTHLRQALLTLYEYSPKRPLAVESPGGGKKAQDRKKLKLISKIREYLALLPLAKAFTKRPLIPSNLVLIIRELLQRRRPHEIHKLMFEAIEKAKQYAQSLHHEYPLLVDAWSTTTLHQAVLPAWALAWATCNEDVSPDSELGQQLETFAHGTLHTKDVSTQKHLATRLLEGAMWYIAYSRWQIEAEAASPFVRYCLDLCTISQDQKHNLIASTLSTVVKKSLSTHPQADGFYHRLLSLLTHTASDEGEEKEKAEKAQEALLKEEEIANVAAHKKPRRRRRRKNKASHTEERKASTPSPTTTPPDTQPTQAETKPCGSTETKEQTQTPLDLVSTAQLEGYFKTIRTRVETCIATLSSTLLTDFFKQYPDASLPVLFYGSLLDPHRITAQTTQENDPVDIDITFAYETPEHQEYFSFLQAAATSYNGTTFTDKNEHAHHLRCPRLVPIPLSKPLTQTPESYAWLDLDCHLPTARTPLDQLIQDHKKSALLNHTLPCVRVEITRFGYSFMPQFVNQLRALELKINAKADCINKEKPFLGLDPNTGAHLLKKLYQNTHYRCPPAPVEGSLKAFTDQFNQTLSTSITKLNHSVLKKGLSDSEVFAHSMLYFALTRYPLYSINFYQEYLAPQLTERQRTAINFKIEQLRAHASETLEKEEPSIEDINAYLLGLAKSPQHFPPEDCRYFHKSGLGVWILAQFISELPPVHRDYYATLLQHRLPEGRGNVLTFIAKKAPLPTPPSTEATSHASSKTYSAHPLPTLTFHTCSLPQAAPSAPPSLG